MVTSIEAKEFGGNNDCQKLDVIYTLNYKRTL